MSWVYLGAAIALELTGTISMKLSEGLTRPVPTALMISCYFACFALLSLALKQLEVGVAYAIWSGVGTALIAIAGVVLFQEHLNPVKIFSLLLIIAGVIGLNLGGAKHTPKASIEEPPDVTIKMPTHTKEWLG